MMVNERISPLRFTGELRQPQRADPFIHHHLQNVVRKSAEKSLTAFVTLW